MTLPITETLNVLVYRKSTWYIWYIKIKEQSESKRREHNLLDKHFYV